MSLFHRKLPDNFQEMLETEVTEHEAALGEWRFSIGRNGFYLKHGNKIDVHGPLGFSAHAYVRPDYIRLEDRETPAFKETRTEFDFLSLSTVCNKREQVTRSALFTGPGKIELPNEFAEMLHGFLRRVREERRRTTAKVLACMKPSTIPVVQRDPLDLSPRRPDPGPQP